MSSAKMTPEKPKSTTWVLHGRGAERGKKERKFGRSRGWVREMGFSFSAPATRFNPHFLTLRGATLLGRPLLGPTPSDPPLHRPPPTIRAHPSGLCNFLMKQISDECFWMKVLGCKCLAFSVLRHKGSTHEIVHTRTATALHLPSVRQLCFDRWHLVPSSRRPSHPAETKRLRLPSTGNPWFPGTTSLAITTSRA